MRLPSSLLFSLGSRVRGTDTRPLGRPRRFEVYERMKGEQKELSVRVTLSEGAHSAVLDASLDAKHALQVQPRRALTGASLSLVAPAPSASAR